MYTEIKLRAQKKSTEISNINSKSSFNNINTQKISIKD